VDRVNNEELHNLYVSPNVIRLMKEMRLGWVGHGAGMGDIRNAYSILVGKPEGRRAAGIDRRTILEWILGKLCGKLWTGCI
jgi:hypothetical protein